MLQVSQIDHCSVIITDVERSRRFVTVHPGISLGVA